MVNRAPQRYTEEELISAIQFYDIFGIPLNAQFVARNIPYLYSATAAKKGGYRRLYGQATGKNFRDICLWYRPVTQRAQRARLVQETRVPPYDIRSDRTYYAKELPLNGTAQKLPSGPILGKTIEEMIQQDGWTRVSNPNAHIITVYDPSGEARHYAHAQQPNNSSVCSGSSPSKKPITEEKKNQLLSELEERMLNGEDNLVLELVDRTFRGTIRSMTGEEYNALSTNYNLGESKRVLLLLVPSNCTARTVTTFFTSLRRSLSYAIARPFEANDESQYAILKADVLPVNGLLFDQTRYVEQFNPETFNPETRKRYSPFARLHSAAAPVDWEECKWELFYAIPTNPNFVCEEEERQRKAREAHVQMTHPQPTLQREVA